MSICKHLKAPGLIGICALLLSGCGHGYYMVRDPATSNTYFTKDVDHPGLAGAVRFKDERTGSEVTLPKSEVKKLSPDEYQKHVKQ